MNRFEQVCFSRFCCLSARVHGLISDGPKSIFSLAMDVSGRSDASLLLLPPRVNNASATRKSDSPLYCKFKFFTCIHMQGRRACPSLWSGFVLWCVPLQHLHSTLGSILDLCHLFISGPRPSGHDPSARVPTCV